MINNRIIYRKVENMFNNVGGKLKGVAKICFWIVTVIVWIFAGVTILGGFAAMTQSVGAGLLTIILGALIGVIGTLIAWLEVILLYAFGVITENTDKLVELAGGVSSSNTKSKELSLQDIRNDIKESAPNSDNN